MKNLGVSTFALTGFLIASMLVFSLVALPELLPALFPALRSGTLEIRATSTTGALGAPGVFDLSVRIDSISLHRVGIGGGAWIQLLNDPLRLKPIYIGDSTVFLEESRIPIGDYNLVSVSLGNASALTIGGNVTLKEPTQDLKIPTAFTMAEGKRVGLTLDVAFDENAILQSRQFVPLFTVTVEEPRPYPSGAIEEMNPIASFGPETRNPNDSASFEFTIDQNAAVQGYLLHAKGGSGEDDTFDLSVEETGEFWDGISGDLWLLGGNLTAGTYNVEVTISPFAVNPVTFSIALYRIPRIPTDLLGVVVSGYAPAARPPTLAFDEFALETERAGLYDISLGVLSGDYEFLVDDNPVAIVTENRTVNIQLDQGVHRFQLIGDFSGSGRDTQWSIGVQPLPSTPTTTLSREAVIAALLPILAVLLLGADLARRRFAQRKRQ